MSEQQNAPEFSRIIRLDEIGRIEWPARIVADAAECAALAQRFGFLSIESLSASYSCERDGTTVITNGTVRAELTQPCIATGEPVSEKVDDPFTIRFLPAEQINISTDRDEDEVELDAHECDILPYGEGRIDIGDAVAETLALAVNPYPRSPNAEAFLREAGVKSEEEAAAEANPFAALKTLQSRAKR